MKTSKNLRNSFTRAFLEGAVGLALYVTIDLIVEGDFKLKLSLLTLLSFLAMYVAVIGLLYSWDNDIGEAVRTAVFSSIGTHIMDIFT